MFSILFFKNILNGQKYQLFGFSSQNTSLFQSWNLNIFIALKMFDYLTLAAALGLFQIYNLT